MEQVLKDRHGSVIGRMRDTGSEIVLVDKHGSTLGRYKKGSNATYDAHGSRVGTGNILASLLPRP